jgi:hypothetical protein
LRSRKAAEDSGVDGVFPNGRPPKLRRSTAQAFLRFRIPYELGLGLLWTALAVATSRWVVDWSPAAVGATTFAAGAVLWLVIALFFRRSPDVSIAAARKRFEEVEARAMQADELLVGHALRICWRLLFALGPTSQWERHRADIRLTLFQACYFNARDARHFALVATLRYAGGQDTATVVCDGSVREHGPWFLEREGIPGRAAASRQVATAVVSDAELDEFKKLSDDDVRRWYASKFGITDQRSLNSLLIEGLRSIQAYVAIPIEVGNEVVGVVTLDSTNREALKLFFRGQEKTQRKNHESTKHSVHAVFANLRLGELT